MAKDGVIPHSEGRPKATVHRIDARLPMNNKSAVNKNNCHNILVSHADEIARFKRHAKELSGPTEHVTILLLNVNDVNGRPLSKKLLPKHNWDAANKRQEKPFIRGLFTKELLCKKLDIINKEAAEKLKDMTSMAIVVVDYNNIEIFAA